MAENRGRHRPEYREQIAEPPGAARSAGPVSKQDLAGAPIK